ALVSSRPPPDPKVSATVAGPPATWPYLVTPVNGRLKRKSKWTVYRFPAPQKLPDVAEPWISVWLTTVKLVASTWRWLPARRRTRPAGAALAGKVKSARPVRVVAVSWVVTPLPRFTR